MHDLAILRILDANANRAREALRVLEDITRFAFNDGALSGQLKELRHALAATLARLPMDHALLTRDTPHDVGTTLTTDAEATRRSLGDVATAAGKRLSEALRSLEECAKTIDSGAAAVLEALRYRGYALEQAVARVGTFGSATARFAKVRLYVLLTDALVHPAVGGWRGALEAILAEAPPDGSVAVQLREKDLADGELLHRATHFAKRCRDAGVVSIVNDRPDVALVAGADGLHVGQEDLPAEEVRRLVGTEMIVGVSTENLDQARGALRAGATYLGVGPMFVTSTKTKPRLAGPAYAAAALAEIPLPLVPIGGITLENIRELTTGGQTRAAVCAAIVAQRDPGAAVRAFLRALAPAATMAASPPVVPVPTEVSDPHGRPPFQADSAENFR